MHLGFYYSHGQDWINGGAIGLASDKNPPPPWDPAQKVNMTNYVDKVALPQLSELCSNYGEFPEIIWYDTPRGIDNEIADRIQNLVHKLRPNIIRNDRLGGDYSPHKGDLRTPEQFVPPQGYHGYDWESCGTMGKGMGWRGDVGAWGCKSTEKEFKSPETLISNLIDIASKGGNYLLNVGPTSEGLIPQPSLDRLKEIGKWMKVNGEAIYGTRATPFGPEAGYFSDTEKEKDGNPKFIPSWEWRATSTFL
jgi:alpha-L-fucosidase